MSAPDPDAELIALCDRFAEIEAQENAIEFEGDDEFDRARAPLDAERKAIKERLYDLPDPSTLAGARAMARAAMATAPREIDGQPYFDGGDAEEIFAFGAVQFLAADNGAAVPVELEMLRKLRKLPTMRAGWAITWMGAAMSVVSGCSTPDAAYADWLASTTKGESPA